MTDTDNTYVSPWWPSFQKLWWIVLILMLLALLLMQLLGYGWGRLNDGSRCAVKPPAPITNTVEVVPPDTLAPKLLLKDASIVHLTTGSQFNDPGASAIDNYDGDINVVTTGSVDVNTPGEYTLTYTVTDAAGNTSSVDRTVIVDSVPDTIGPVISLNEASVVRILVGENYSDAGANATDINDGEVSVETTGAVDASTPGEYTITYTATDEAGNTTSTVRTVIVASLQPVPNAVLYFGNSQDHNPTDPGETLAVVIEFLQSNSSSTAIISGYHSQIGNYDYNQDLSYRRAEGIRQTLLASGVDDSRIILEKPVETTGSGSAAEARRVEVSVAR